MLWLSFFCRSRSKARTWKSNFKIRVWKFFWFATSSSDTVSSLKVWKSDCLKVFFDLRPLLQTQVPPWSPPHLRLLLHHLILGPACHIDKLEFAKHKVAEDRFGIKLKRIRVGNGIKLKIFTCSWLKKSSRVLALTPLSQPIAPFHKMWYDCFWWGKKKTMMQKKILVPMWRMLKTSQQKW